MATSPPPARIRPYEAKDLPAVRYFIGQNDLECLPAANSAIFRTTGGASLWLVLTAVLAAATGWWPAMPSGPDRFARILTLFIPLAPVALAVLLMLGVSELYHRPTFEAAVQRRLGRQDLRDIATHYALAPSGVFVLEYGDKVIGVVAIDASTGTNDVKAGGLKGAKADNVEAVARIRHLATSIGYREAGLDADLLDFALERVFAASLPAQRVEIEARPALQRARVALLRSKGFQEVGRVAEDVVRRADGDGLLAKASRTMDAWWPLDLGARLYALQKS
jgi:ribosomal protein S18 acetylase RimI-like enzyme